MFDRPHEYWATIIGMLVYLLARDLNRTTIMRSSLKTGSSGLLALGLDKPVSDMLNIGINLSVVLIMAVGLILLDQLAALARDKEQIIKLLTREAKK